MENRESVCATDGRATGAVHPHRFAVPKTLYDACSLKVNTAARAKKIARDATHR